MSNRWPVAARALLCWAAVNLSVSVCFAETGGAEADEAAAVSPAAASTAEAMAGLPDPPNVPSTAALAQALAAWRAHVAAGTADLEARRWAAAESHFRAALVLDPSDRIRMTQLAAALEGRGARHRGTIVLRQAASLAFRRESQALSWAEVARNAEARGLTTEAIDAWTRTQCLDPDPAIEERLEKLRKIKQVKLMSPRSLCPRLLDEWGCAPSTRPAEGDMRCSCTIERLEHTAAAIEGGLRSTDEFGIPRLDEGVLLSAALIRVRGAGTALIDVRYLVVETGTGGWQLVDRVVEGWQPGAAMTAWDGALLEMGFKSLGGVERSGESLMLRVVKRFSDTDFESEGLVRMRVEFAYLCEASRGPRCVRLPTAGRLSLRPLPGTEGPMKDLDWSVDLNVGQDGAVVVTQPRGQLPAGHETLVGTHTLEALEQLPQVVVVPLR